MDNETVPRLTKPKSWTVTWLGLYHEHAIIVILLVSSAPIGLLWAVGAETLPGWVELSLVVLAVYLISGGARHHVLVPLTRLLKRLLVNSVNLVYFRSFRQDHSYTARDTLGPILGCIGKLTTVHNNDYIQGLVDVDGHSHDEDTWFSWLELGEILSDGLEARKFHDAEWQDGVCAILSESDLAVIDVSSGSEMVAWELRQASELLPDDRIILLRDSDAPHSGDTVDVIEYESSVKGRKRLRRALRQRLTQIES